MGGLIINFIILVDRQDIKDLVRLYEIEFGKVELPKLILVWKGSFRTSWVEGVLWNGSLIIKLQAFVSVQAARARLLPSGQGRFGGIGSVVVYQLWT